MEVLTDEAHRAYWGAIAQIIPVLALALVIEARVQARRWAGMSEKDIKASKTTRSYLVFCYAISVLVSVVLMIVSLYELTTVESGMAVRVFSTSGVSMLITFVVVIPISDIIVVSIGAKVFALWSKLPFSSFQRNRRELLRLKDRFTRHLLNSRADKLSALQIKLWAVWQENSLHHALPYSRELPNLLSDLESQIENADEIISRTNDGILEALTSQRAVAALLAYDPTKVSTDPEEFSRRLRSVSDS